jgi:dimethyladenosine transferase
MENLSNIGVVKDILARHGFSFSKGLGQNFLINPTVCPKMAEQGNAQPGWGIIEIGAGVGVLTAQLAQRADKVVCIEIDQRLLPILAETLGEFNNIKIINQDVLKVDLNSLIAQEFPHMPVAICANLPYYITSPIIMKILEDRLPITSLTVMVQKEAAQRICAQPGTREVGAVSIAVQYYAQPQILFPVSRGSFMPSPDVDSAVIRLDIRPQPLVQVAKEEDFFRVVKGAFSQRRKTLSNTLSSSFGLSKAQTARWLEEAGVSASLRAEQLSMEQFAQIANAYTALYDTKE